MNKRTFLSLVVVLLATVCLAQNNSTIPSGTIFLTNNETIEFTNLKFIDNTVVFINNATKTEFTYFKNTVKYINNAMGQRVFTNGNLVYATENLSKKKDEVKQDLKAEMPIENSTILVETKTKEAVSIKKDSLPNLVFISGSNITQNSVKLSPDEVRNILKTNSYALEKYNSGRTTKTIGDVMLGFGLGFFIGSGISNMSKANNSSDNTYQTDSKSGPTTGIVVGLVITAASIPVKIAGASAIKKSIKYYNEKPITSTNTLSLKINTNGLGFVYSW